MRAAMSLALLVCLTLAARADHPATAPESEEGEARLLRFPSIHSQQIAFCHAGDIYIVPSRGGIARKITSHSGYEMFPHFSPDGKWLAFTGQYDGNTEVYVVPSEGGIPRRLTYTATLGRDEVSDRMGPNNIVLGWKNNGKEVLFRSRMHSFNDFVGQLYLVPLEGGLAEPLPLPRSGFACFSPDDTKLVYNRVFREFRTWKRYRGGMADDVWLYDFATRKTENLTRNPAQDIMPMWHGRRVYFLSDRDGRQRMNLYVLDLESRQTRQLTQFTDFDIRFPSLGDSAIVFEYAGWIYRLDLENEQFSRVPIRIPDDHATGRGGLVNVSKNIASYEISPDGKRALFSARGEIFTVPAQSGRTINLTNTSGVHERCPKWSPDGKSIAYISDSSGEDEVWVVSADGSGSPRQLTQNGDTYKFEISWSPDSKKVLWSDKKNRLQYVEVATRQVHLVLQAKVWEVRDAVWSPDSRWLAFSQEERTGLDRVYLYSLEQEQLVPVTDGWFLSTRPQLSSDGQYLFLVSRRDFNPIISETEWNHAYVDMERIYLVPLTQGTPSPFRLRSDELPDSDKGDGDREHGKAKDVVVQVDVAGLPERLLQVPVPPSQYRGLASVGSLLYYLRKGYKDSSHTLCLYDLSARKETTLGSVNGFEISADGKKMLVSQDGKYGIIDLPHATVTLGQPLSLSGLEMRLDRHEEWKQIYGECWRQMRDFFYDPNMNGVDWKAVRERYAPLVPHVGHRADLTYVIGEMIAELSAGHAYVGGGDMPQPARIPVGLLGARLKRDAETGYYRIESILRGSRWDPHLNSPLNALGVEARPGEYILAVNGQPVNELRNIYEALLNQAGKQVKLKLAPEPRDRNSRQVIIEPISNEGQLYYHEWVLGNIKKVHKATEGKVGYIHIPDMLTNGLNQFSRYYYPQTNKSAMIIDVRGNAGGNVSPMLIERLRREIAMVTIARNSIPKINPTAMIYGPQICLLNEFSASDGDLFPFRFRQHHMGKLVGKRSWGGVVGIRGSLPLLDGGYLNRPEFSRYDVDGKEWIIEGVGVTPDIEVDNDPAREYEGIDEQLNRAVEEILVELKTKEKALPPPPPYPKK